MTNEELVRRYYGGDERALEELYRRNLGLIRRIARETAREFNCLHMDRERPGELSGYTKTILEDLCGEGALEFLTRVQSREYDESRAVLATYLYPHLKGRMTRWLEQHIGNLSLSKHEMDAVRQAQRLYHSGQFSIEEIAEKMDVLLEQAVKHIRYNTHFVGVNDLIPGSYDGDPFERLMPGNLSVSAEQVVYRKVCIELLQELFDALPKKDRDILGKFYGVFGFEKTSLKEIGMYHMMKESAVEKAKERAVTKLKKAYPGSRLQIWRNVHRMILLDGSGRRLLFDAVFPVLHGKNGEDGTVQGLFELAGVPVIGCGTLSSALCMDKDRAHQLAALAGIRVPRSHVFHSSDDFSRIAQAAEELGYPVFVKPVRAGSSFGITKVSGPEELPAAMEEAFRHDSAVILEETIPGFEVGCAVMGNEELTVGLVDEIALSEGFFNYEEKYTLKTSAIHCPARIPPEKAAEIQAAAKTIYRALDCRVFARVDLFLTPDGEIVFNEVNTIPGFTAHSRYPSMMQGIGISFGELVTRLIELGVAG